MSQLLSVGNFRFLSPEEIADFDLIAVPTQGDTGYIIEWDLKYPENSMNSTLTINWHWNISPSRQTCLAISAAKLKLMIENSRESLYPIS